MASMTRPRLQHVRPELGGLLVLTFVDGATRKVDLRDDIASLPGLRPLADAEAFATATVADNGWTVEWPDCDIQIGADTLWAAAMPL